MMMLQFFETDDTTLVVDLAITGYEAGSDSDTITVHLWFSKDTPGPQPAEDVLVVLRTEDPSSTGTYLAKGTPAQDEQWGRARIVGYNSTGDASWVPSLTDWQTLGSFGGLLIPTIPQNCAIHLEVRFHPPGTASAGPIRHSLLAIDSEHSQAAPMWLDRGVLDGVGDLARSGLIDGLEVTSSSPADSDINISAGRWLYKGSLGGSIEQAFAIDQTDGDTAALAAGESYWAAVSMGSTPTITKGSKGATPTKPAAPAGEAVVAYVRIDHDPGGGAIEAADIDASATVYGRYLLVPGSGFDATVHGGQAIASGTWRYRSTTTPLTFPASSTSKVWILGSGNLSVAATAPETSALELWEVITDGSAITTVTDRRTYNGRSRTIRLSGSPSGTGEFAASLVADPSLQIESVHLRASDNGLGTAGQTKVDLLIDGVTVYTSSATSDLRPVIAFDATKLVVAAGPAEVLTLRRGQVLSASVVEVPTGGTPADLELVVVARVP